MVGKLVTDPGLNELAKLLGGSGTPMAYVCVGQGSTDPSVTDTALQDEVARKPASISVSGSQVTFEATFAEGELGETAVSEIGLTNQAAGGTLYYREVRNALGFDATVGATIRVKASFARGAA